jgi:hypothetical protein
MKKILILLTMILMTACAGPGRLGVGPLVSVVDIKNLDSETEKKLSEIKTFSAVSDSTMKIVKKAQATSCKNQIYDPPASREDAEKQLKFRALESNADAIANVFCEPKKGTSLITNCWESITCIADLVSTKETITSSTREKLNSDEKNETLDVTLLKSDMDESVTLIIRISKDATSLKVDNEEFGFSKSGTFQIKKYAKLGVDNEYQVIATYADGKRDVKTARYERSVKKYVSNSEKLNPSKVKSRTPQDAVAVIIGIADYKNLPRADFANDDARLFYDYAIRALGIKPENVKLLVDGDAEEAEIIKAFRTWLPSRVKSTTDVYVFYSGHGLPTADGQGLYLIPPRADRDVIDDTAIPFNKINTAIQAAKPKSVTIFMDACYSGQARSGETLIASARPVAIKAEKTLFPDSFTVFSASQNDQISSSSPDLKHGIFSYYLMRGMEGEADSNRDGKITLGEIQIYLVENVGRQAAMMSRKQEPQVIGDVNRVLVGR